MSPLGPGATDVQHRARSWIDAALPFALALVLFALYDACFQTRLYGDGGLLVQVFAEHADGGGLWYHALYMPMAGLLRRLAGGLAPADVLRLLSSACGALGAASTYGVARLYGLSRARSMAAAALLATSPAWWFFSTTIELHALHGAVVVLCALVVLAAPWQRPALAAAISAVPLLLVFPSHQSGLLLGAGFSLLPQVARERRGLPPLPWRTLLLVVAPLMALALSGGILLASLMQVRAAADITAASATQVVAHWRGFSLDAAWRGWALPLGCLGPLALWALARGRWGRWHVLAAGAFVLPSLSFFLAWGLAERGGYTLGSSLIPAVLAARGLRAERRGALAAWLALALAQLCVSVALARSWDTPSERRLLAERARAAEVVLGSGGTLLSFNPTLQFIDAFVPGVRELDLTLALTAAMGRGEPPEAFVRAVRPRIEAALAERDVALDTAFRPLMAERAPAALAYAEALEAWLASACVLESGGGAAGFLVRVRPR